MGARSVWQNGRTSFLAGEDQIDTDYGDWLHIEPCAVIDRENEGRCGKIGRGELHG